MICMILSVGDLAAITATHGALAILAWRQPPCGAAGGRRLRRKTEQATGLSLPINTARNAGYRFFANAAVRP